MDDNLITYKKLSRTDIPILTELVKTYTDVFETENFSMPNSEYFQTLLDNDNIIFCVALLGNFVIGGLTAYILPSVYYPSSQVYIYDLAVKPNMQRQGIGQKIIAFLQNCCIELGHAEIYIQADIEDQHAIDFYKATGGHPEKVIHFTYDLKTLK